MESFKSTKYLTLDGAKRMMAAAEAEAVNNNWNVAIAIVDAAGNLLMFEKARKSTRLNSSHSAKSRMPSSA